MSYKMMQNIHEELDKIAEKGLNTSKLETAYKLIDMWKDMENVEYWKCKKEYYNQVMDEMDGGNTAKRAASATAWDVIAVLMECRRTMIMTAPIAAHVENITLENTTAVRTVRPMTTT